LRRFFTVTEEQTPPAQEQVSRQCWIFQEQPARQQNKHYGRPGVLAQVFW
jgi:hypothetical protein